MLLTTTQVITIELAILIIYFCYKETRSANVIKRKKEKGKLSEHSRGKIAKTNQKVD